MIWTGKGRGDDTFNLFQFLYFHKRPMWFLLFARWGHRGFRKVKVYWASKVKHVDSCLKYICSYIWSCLVALMVKSLFAMQETQEMQVWSLGWEDPLEKRRATHSSILAWRIPWTEGPGWATVYAVTKVTWVTNTHTWLYVYLLILALNWYSFKFKHILKDLHF